MNERIRELALQAGHTPLPGFDFANDLQEVFLKKFAELIVEEVLGVALYGDEFEQARSNVKLLFGVE